MTQESKNDSDIEKYLKEREQERRDLEKETETKIQKSLSPEEQEKLKLQKEIEKLKIGLDMEIEDYVFHSQEFAGLKENKEKFIKMFSEKIQKMPIDKWQNIVDSMKNNINEELKKEPNFQRKHLMQEKLNILNEIEKKLFLEISKEKK